MNVKFLVIPGEQNQELQFEVVTACRSSSNVRKTAFQLTYKLQEIPTIYISLWRSLELLKSSITNDSFSFTIEAETKTKNNIYEQLIHAKKLKGIITYHISFSRL